MTVVEALAILEAATLECKMRTVDTPELPAAIDFLGPAHNRPEHLSDFTPFPLLDFIDG